MRICEQFCLSGVILLALCVTPVRAAVSFPGLFGDHAIVQRAEDACVWGRAEPRETVAVALGPASATAVAESDGWWFARLDTSSLGDGPFDLSATAPSGSAVSHDILVGEVWLAGGQSNMAFTMSSWDAFGAIDGYEERAAACVGRPIRMFRITNDGAKEPVKGDARGRWVVVSPETLGGVTAVGYTFIDTLQRSIGGAAGVVDISVAGTRCWAWLPRETLDAYPELKAERIRQEAAAANGETVRKPVEFCWNNRFHPVSRMRCRGVVWYQGEDDSSQWNVVMFYPRWFAAMVSDMRRAEGQPDLPFLYCQVAGWGATPATPSDNPGPANLREAQRLARRTIPGSAMAVTLDNSEYEIHGRFKGPVGDRLAALALNKIYGRADVPCESPDLLFAESRATDAVLTFANGGAPLAAGPIRTEYTWNAHSNDTIRIERRSSPASQLEGFTICGGDGVWRWADAEILGPDTVRVWADGAENPVAVRYAWGGQGFGNLVNEAGFPASPFAATAVPRRGASQTVLQEGRTVLVYAADGMFNVAEPLTIELLSVGGGGGGGKIANEYAGAGGGGGGGVVTNTLALSAGVYAVSIGSGGQIGENGGDSVLSLGGAPVATAYGGGAGAGGSWNGGAGGDGASGGGGCNKADGLVYNGGNAIFGGDGNLGSAGGASTTSQYVAGGGGGAGEPGGDGSGNNPGRGGDGVAISIVGPGPDTFYGGGGAAWRSGNYTTPGGRGGGGGNAKGTGSAGEDGRVGGGCGGQRGGSGVLIIAFPRPSEPSEKDGFFKCAGGDDVLTNRTARGREEVRIFRQNGILTVAGRGTMEVLAVGGGGGGGLPYNEWCGAGGGGAGGVVHYTNLVVEAGTYEIVVGAGGGVATNGFPTSGLGVTAYGGGAGAGGSWNGGPGKDGASGGGGSAYGSGGEASAGGEAAYTAYANRGNNGGMSSTSIYGAGGGGGAGGPGAPGGSGNVHRPGNGGAGYVCAITGTETAYGGGGAGTSKDYTAAGGAGGGGDSVLGSAGLPGAPNTGGGGAGHAAGGSGVFIVRYGLKPPGTLLHLE